MTGISWSINLLSLIIIDKHLLLFLILIIYIFFSMVNYVVYPHCHLFKKKQLPFVPER